MLPISLQNDLQVADGLETVALRQPGVDTALVVAQALRRPAGTREAAASGGTYTRADARWLVPASQVQEPPRIGAKIVDAAGTEWTVLQAELTALGAVWALACRALAIVHRLDLAVDIERAAWRKSAEGAAVAEWRLWRRGVAARIQPLEIRLDREHGQRTSRATHRVYFAEELPLDGNSRIVHAGAVYHVLGCRMLERIDLLMEVDCERSPWPLGSEANR